MSDLTPAEQARAARWAADWLVHHREYGTTPAPRLLERHADRIDPPETVVSLRAERDKALGDVRYWRRAAKDEHEAWGRTGQALAEAKAELARFRTARHPSRWPGGEHWLGGDHSNQTPRDGAE